MSDQYVPALPRRFLEDMQIRGRQEKTLTMYLRGMRDFTRFLAHAPDSATPEELQAFQLDVKERGICAQTLNNRPTVLSFFYAATCPRPEIKRHTWYQRATKNITIVLSAVRWGVRQNKLELFWKRSRFINLLSFELQFVFRPWSFPFLELFQKFTPLRLFRGMFAKCAQGL